MKSLGDDLKIDLLLDINTASRDLTVVLRRCANPIFDMLGYELEVKGKYYAADATGKENSECFGIELVRLH